MFFSVTVGVQGHAPEIEKDIWSANLKTRNCFIECYFKISSIYVHLNCNSR